MNVLAMDLFGADPFVVLELCQSYHMRMMMCMWELLCMSYVVVDIFIIYGNFLSD